MVDYYYSRWYEGRVHEVELFPKSSTGYLAYEADAFDLNGNPTAHPMRVSAHPTGILKGEKLISGGAISGLHLSPFYNFMEASLRVGETRIDHMELINEGGTPDDVGYGTTEPSQVAMSRLFTEESSLPEDLIEEGAGIYHYGWRRLVNNAGFIGGLSGPHHEIWAARSQSYMLSRYGFFIPGAFNFSRPNNDQDWNSAPIDQGIAPPPDEWPEGAIRAEAGTLQEQSIREYLEIRINGWSAPGASNSTFKGGYNTSPWGSWADTAVGLADVLGWSEIPYGGGSVELPSAEITDWHNTPSIDQTTEEYEAWSSRMYNLSFVPRPRPPTMCSTLYPPGEGIGGIGAGEEVNHDVWDWMEEADIIGLSAERAAEVGHTDDFPARSLDVSVYVKFRTPRYRFVFEVEPEITGRADNVRRRFT